MCLAARIPVSVLPSILTLTLTLLLVFILLAVLGCAWTHVRLTFILMLMNLDGSAVKCSHAYVAVRLCTHIYICFQIKMQNHT